MITIMYIDCIDLFVFNHCIVQIMLNITSILLHHNMEVRWQSGCVRLIVPFGATLVRALYNIS